MVNKFLLLTLMLICKFGYAQYDNTYLKIINSKNLFKKVKGTFFDKVKLDTINGENVNYMYQFSDSLYIEVWFPFDTNSSKCNYFSISHQQINIEGLFDNDFACELEIASLSVYKTEFYNKKYLLVTGINSGSGDYTTSVICNLFDIANHKKIIYYPLWSKYGGTSCFGDFNNNGKLDFLKVRNYQGSRSTYIVTIMELTNDSFINIDEAKYFLIVKKQSNDSFKVIKKKWF